MAFPRRRYGLLELESVHETARREARRLFLIAASDHKEIRLLDRLYDEVLNERPAGPSELGTLLHKWARRRNLDYDWVLEEAKEVYFRSINLESNELIRVSFEVLAPAYRPSPFRLPPWVPTEPAEHYKSRVLMEFQVYLDDWIALCKLKRKPLLQRRRRSANRDVRSDHYGWAAEHICLRRGWTQIAEKNSLRIYTQAISDAVHKVLSRVGLPKPTVSRKNKANDP